MEEKGSSNFILSWNPSPFSFFGSASLLSLKKKKPCQARGGSRISGKGVHINKGVEVRFGDFI